METGRMEDIFNRLGMNFSPNFVLLADINPKKILKIWSDSITPILEYSLSHHVDS